MDNNTGNNIERTYSPLVLAYLGDAVIELMVRNELTANGNKPVDKLNREATGIVSAVAQSQAVELLLKHFTQDELKIYKRGRNANSHTVSKNAPVIDYRRATGLEAVFGYLHLKGETDRLEQLYNIMRGKVNE